MSSRKDELTEGGFQEEEISLAGRSHSNPAFRFNVDKATGNGMVAA